MDKGKRQLETGKVPPKNTAMEEVVLGALLLESASYLLVDKILSPEVFYKNEHKAIYSVIEKLHNNHVPVDILTVVSALRKEGVLEEVGGIYYITDLTSKVGSGANIEHHSLQILEKYILREIIGVSGILMNDAFDETVDVHELLDSALTRLEETRSRINALKPNINLKDILKDSLTKLEERVSREDKDSKVPGVASGSYALDRTTFGWAKGNLIVVGARPSVGKCLGKGTKVLMHNGDLKNIEDVIVGDKLMGNDSTPRNVLSLARGTEQMYWVRQNRGIDYRVNGSHILSLKRSRTEWSHKHGDVLNISVNEYIGRSNKFKTNYKGYKVAVDFPGQDVVLDPYFVGIWIGDGTASKAQVSNPDKEIIDYIYEYAETLGLQVTVDRSSSCYGFSITNAMNRRKYKGMPLYTILKKMNLINNKHIPQNYLINSKENRLQLLAGLLDTDGHYIKESNVFEIIQKEKRISNQIKFLCDSLGFCISIKEKIATMKRDDGSVYRCLVYRMVISGDIDVIPTKVKRKQARKRTADRDWKHTGIVIEKDIVDEYFGFEIDGNKLFLLEDMTVTHNTAIVLFWARHAAREKYSVLFISLEMSEIQLGDRLLIGEGWVDTDKYKLGLVSQKDIDNCYKGYELLKNLPIDFDFDSNTVRKIRSRALKLKSEGKLDLVIIDYLQLMDSESKNRNYNKGQEVGEVSRKLKLLAKELEVPIILLSQLNREAEKNRTGGFRPKLSELRETGALEQDSDIVILLYRPWIYPELRVDNISPDESFYIVAKNREGAVGMEIPFKHNESLTRIDYELSGVVQESIEYKEEESELPF